jgi:hypothetical protein
LNVAAAKGTDLPQKLFQHGLHGAAAMDRQTVPDDQQSFIEGLLQVLQETGREEAVDRGFAGSESTATVARDAADDREMIPCLPFDEDRSLAARNPGPGDGWEWIKPRFIDQDNRSLLAGRLFSATSSAFWARRRWRLRPVAERDGRASVGSSRSVAAACRRGAKSASRRIPAAERRPRVSDSSGRPGSSPFGFHVQMIH